LVLVILSWLSACRSLVVDGVVVTAAPVRHRTVEAERDRGRAAAERSKQWQTRSDS